jgi:hypothetical protein
MQVGGSGEATGRFMADPETFMEYTRRSGKGAELSEEIQRNLEEIQKDRELEIYGRYREIQEDL